MADAYEWRNPVYNQLGFIDCEINHATHGWVPFSAHPEDPVDAGRLTYEAILASGTPVADYVPPPIEDVRRWMTPVTQRQMRMELLANGITGNDIADAINKITDQHERERARIEFEYAEGFSRNNPSVIAVLKLLSYDDKKIDTFYKKAVGDG
jgi:hypothetical protein